MSVICNLDLIDTYAHRPFRPFGCLSAWLSRKATMMFDSSGGTVETSRKSIGLRVLHLKLIATYLNLFSDMIWEGDQSPKCHKNQITSAEVSTASMDAALPWFSQLSWHTLRDLALTTSQPWSCWLRSDMWPSVQKVGIHQSVGSTCGLVLPNIRHSWGDCPSKYPSYVPSIHIKWCI